MNFLVPSQFNLHDLYLSTYNSPLVNLVDDQFKFKYVEFEPLEFSKLIYFKFNISISIIFT